MIEVEDPLSECYEAEVKAPGAALGSFAKQCDQDGNPNAPPEASSHNLPDLHHRGIALVEAATIQLEPYSLSFRRRDER